jgi:small subunit ribosomal protein S1
LDLTTVAKVGDTMEAIVVKTSNDDNMVVLSYRRLAQEKGNEKLKEAFENHEVLTGKVTKVLNGGLSVVVDDARVFVPASLVADSYVKDLHQYDGQEIQFVITEFNPRKRRIIGDRKQLLVAKKEEIQKEFFDNIHVGDIIEGTVKNVTDFGAFIDLGGVDGLLHISEMSWGHVDNPKKLYHVDDKVKVFIKNINGHKIALSCKFDDANPWNGASEKYAVGTIVTGTVARMTDFGAFIELEPGIDALLHVSQISRDHVEKPSDVLKTGMEVTAKVVELRENEHKISLSIKAMDQSEDDAEVETVEGDNE